MAALEHSQTIETILCRLETVLRRNYISDTGYADDCRYVQCTLYIKVDVDTSFSSPKCFCGLSPFASSLPSAQRLTGQFFAKYRRPR